MSSVVISGDISGSVTLDAPSVAGTTVLTLPTTSGTVMVNGPAFRAAPTGTQTLTVNVLTKIQFQTKVFDTNTNYDNVTNYRFTPTVAGYYQVTAGASAQSTSSANAILTAVYKNGSLYEFGSAVPCSTNSFGYSQVTTLVYFNGSSDYIESYAQATGASGTVVCNGTYFQAAMVRGA